MFVIISLEVVFHEKVKYPHIKESYVIEISMFVLSYHVIADHMIHKLDWTLASCLTVLVL